MSDAAFFPVKAADAGARHAVAHASLRLFYALWPDQTMRDALARLPLAVAGRRTPPRQYHLTLAFLGRQPVSMIPPLEAILNRLPAQAVTLELDRFGIFRRHRILWAGVASAPPSLTALHTALLEQLQGLAIVLPEGAPFKPHVTLMRDVDSQQIDPVWLPPPLVWRMQEVALIASRTTPAGALYDVLASRRFPAD